MATLQEVQDAIDAYQSAQNDVTAATAQLVATETAVQTAVASEQAVFDAAQVLFQDQLQLARDAAGFPAAVTAYQAANDALNLADGNLKALMASYASGV